MLKWIVWLSIGFAAWKILFPKTPYANCVTQGWLGGAAGNLPTVAPAMSILGAGVSVPDGSPGLNFAPSNSTNGGSC